MALPHFTFIFQSLISCIGGCLDPMLLLNMNRKPYMGSPMEQSNLMLNDLEGSTPGNQYFKALYLVIEPR